MAEDKRPVRVDSADEDLHTRWLHVVTMRQQASNAPLAPRWMRFRDTGERGVGWIDLMEQWESERFTGEPPIEFEKYARSFLVPFHA